MDKLIEKAKRLMNKMSPEEKEAMFKAQRESYVIAEMGFGSDKDEAAYREAVQSSDADKIAEYEAASQNRMTSARALLEK